SWDEWRTRALEEIRADIEEQRDRLSQRAAWGPRQNALADNSRLVEIFLSEGDSDAAWRAATEGGCADSHMELVAASRETDHPEQALGAYLKMVEHRIAHAPNYDYSKPIGLLVRCAGLARSFGQLDEFRARVDVLRQKYESKRKFIKLLDETKI
ncbi:MAG: hypothetical protein GY953_30620, partial [bacterium]|nr:hypothetical protein [bacterium]